MVKRLLFIFIMALGTVFSYGQNIGVPHNVVLQVNYFDPYKGLGNQPRGPENPLTIGLEDHTLYMSNVDFDITLQLTDANDNVVYTTFVAANTSTVVLPSTLTGEYKIELIDDERCFWGYIEL